MSYSSGEAMSNWIESLKGSGNLQLDANSAPIPVSFDFIIHCSAKSPPPGLPPPPARKQGQGTVSADDGRSFHEGFYQLVTSSGQQIRVQKLGIDWHILGPPW
jgi:hypothetical protein